MDAPSAPTFGKYLILTTLAGGRPVPVSGSWNAVNTRVAAGFPASVSSLQREGGGLPDRRGEGPLQVGADPVHGDPDLAEIAGPRGEGLPRPRRPRERGKEQQQDHREDGQGEEDLDEGESRPAARRGHRFTASPVTDTCSSLSFRCPQDDDLHLDRVGMGGGADHALPGIGVVGGRELPFGLRRLGELVDGVEDHRLGEVGRGGPPLRAVRGRDRAGDDLVGQQERGRQDRERDQHLDQGESVPVTHCPSPCLPGPSSSRPTG